MCDIAITMILMCAYIVNSIPLYFRDIKVYYCALYRPNIYFEMYDI